MRHIVATIAIAAMAVFSSCSSTGSMGREAKQEVMAKQYQDIMALLESGTFIYTAQSAQASGGKNIQLNTNVYSLDFKDNYVKADLPFYGRGYTSHYSNDPGIKFEGEPQDLKISGNEKKFQISVQFRVSKINDTFDATLNISSSGYGNLTVISRNRQSISYYGYISEMPEDYTF